MRQSTFPFGMVCVMLLAPIACAAQTAAMTNGSDAAFDSNPVFAVVSIRLSPPEEADDWGTQVRGHHFVATYASLQDLICYAYGVNSHQLVHAPAWFTTERFDVDAIPNTEILPKRDQYRVMLQKALADRFGLAFHLEQRKLPVLVLSVSKGGAKVKDESSQPYATEGWGVQQGLLNIKAMSFAGVARVLQRTVFDRPVVDHTGLTGRYTFKLRWRPDETQFTQMQGLNVPPDDGAETRDDIFKAALQQLGIRIEAEKAIDDVMVIDHATRPTAN